MFTGIVTEVAEVLAVEVFSDRRRLRLALKRAENPIAVGASIAVAGVCLTAVEIDGGNRTSVVFDVGAETLAVTNAAHWKAGDGLNIERALRVGDELGGHIVSGHVDGLATILDMRSFNEMTHVRLRAPSDLAKFVAKKGSVALDGVSLTVNAVDGDDFEVLLIPHTINVTTWREREVGDFMNFEVDTMARYAERLIGFPSAADKTAD
jgi:riboflavin synthase